MIKIIKSLLRDRLKKKDLLLGFCNMYPASGLLERVGRDWDWIWIDGQHGEHNYDSIIAAVKACELINRPSVVRVPGHDYGIIGRVLDMCTNGIMIPMVDNVDQARDIVKAVKFPPIGQRSYGGRRPIDLYGRAYAHTANEDVVLIVQIETKEGLSNVEEITALPGIDVVFFSPDDMSMQYGLPMDKPRPEDLFDKKMARVAALADKFGKIAGTVVSSPQILQKVIKMGYKLCVSSGDVSLLANGSKHAHSLMYECKK